MPTLRQERNRRQQRNRQDRPLEYLEVCMMDYVCMVNRQNRAREEQARRHGRPLNNQDDKPQLNVTFTPRSIVLTITDDHLHSMLATLVLLALGYTLHLVICTICVYFMGSVEVYNAAEILFLGRIYLWLVCDLMAMWYEEAGDMRHRIKMTAYMLVAGLWLFTLAKLNGVPMF